MLRLFFIVLVSMFLVSCKNSDTENADATTTKSSDAVPALFERTGKLAEASEWEKTKTKVDELKARIAADPKEVKSRLQLATIYISEARITGEHPYYYPAINTILEQVLAIQPTNFEALVLQSSVRMSQHKFAEAKQIATKARGINPSNAYVYGILVDANVELGDYEAALQASDSMQVLKPSLESYARASYLREIYGDYNGAIEAMKLAVKAGLPGSEPFCWSATTLAELYRKTGELKNAAAACEQVLAVRPSYAFAIGKLAEIAMDKKEYDRALSLLDSAATILPEFSFHETMADVYAAQGNTKKAADKYAETLKMLDEDEQSGHSVALEKAKLYMKMGDLQNAKKYADIEYQVRPQNIDVNRELAAIALQQKNIDAAKKHITVASRTGSKDAELLALQAAIAKG